MAKMICFIHNVKLYRTQNRYGGLWLCPTEKCDIKCWEGPTSYPGTQEDFEERKATHKLFDSLWRDEKGPFSNSEWNSKNKRRGRAYKWLAGFLQVEQKHAHIGMLRAEKCREIQEALAILGTVLDGQIDGMG